VRVRLSAVLALLMGVLFVVGSALPAQASGDELAIQGKLTDTSSDEPTPVEGVKLTVTDSDGKEIGTVESDAEGSFSVRVPGNGRYTIEIEEDSLPEGTFLRNADDVTRTVNVLGFSSTVQFQIGPDTRDTTNKFEQALELLVNGLLFGLVLALASLGLSLVFGTMGLTNFAHGELVTLGALLAFTFNVTVGLPLWLAGLIAVLLGALFGYLQDASFWRPLRKRGTGLIAMMIVSIGMSIFLRYLYQYIYGGDTQTFAEYVTQGTINLGPVSIFPKDLVVAGISIAVLVLVSLAVQRTRIGKATRAVSDNPSLSAATGIDVDRVISIVWIVGTALAALAGVLLGLTQQVEFQMGFKILLLVFAAVVLGGLGTIWGAMLGSLIVGVLIEMSTLLIPSELKYVGALAVLIIVLLVRPQGILGRAQRVG
jgi:neutral amino acid transport system permease protein